MNSIVFKFALLIVLVFPLFGVASASEGAVVASGDEAVNVAKDIVKQRFQQRWAFLMERDFESSYSLESPKYRGDNDLDEYKKRFGEDISWKAVNLEEIAFEGENQAMVKYSLEFSFKAPWGELHESTAHHTERWFFEDDEWWHVMKKPAPFDVKPK